MIKMLLNKNQVLEVIESHENVYFTSEQGTEAEKNAFESLSCSTTLKSLVVKYLGEYDGDNFEFKDYEIIDGDSVYILVEK